MQSKKQENYQGQSSETFIVTGNGMSGQPVMLS